MDVCVCGCGCKKWGGRLEGIKGGRDRAREKKGGGGEEREGERSSVNPAGQRQSRQNVCGCFMGKSVIL